MSHCHRKPLLVLAAGCVASFLLACGGGASWQPETVTVTVVGSNAVSHWNEIATATINVPPSATGTPEEQRPNSAVDLATVHVAIYDAVIAIAGTHRPYAITPLTLASGASQEAAAAAAAYRVLLGLFPSRTAQYQAAYNDFLATLPNGNAKAQGLAVGAEVAAGILALRANDGRSVVLAPYEPGTAPGQFRGVNPIGRPNAFIKPFSLQNLSQFRAPGPPALDGQDYAADLNETKALGSATSVLRTPEQTEIARFYTEAPATQQPRNMRVFAMTDRSLAEHARLMAMVWVTQADATNACFESKYHYEAWRPTSAITLADTDGNAATVVDAAWGPVAPTPNHPEYPAAHSCVTTAMAEIVARYYGTVLVEFDFTSTVTGTTRHFPNTLALSSEVDFARIVGGMHFRTSTVDGAQLGRSVAHWVFGHHFQRR